MNSSQSENGEEKKVIEVKQLQEDPSDSKDQKKNRRKRNDSKDREFVCGCGKNYLSYPALYTHIKQKHENTPPAGTAYPCANGKGRKGRPKVCNSIVLINQQNTDQDSINFENDMNDSEISEDDYDPLDELLYFLKTLGKHLKQEYDADFFKNAMYKFPYDTFQHQSQYYQTIIDNLKPFELMTKDQFSKFLQQEQLGKEGLKTTKLNQIFAIFLYEISICITPECFKEMAYLVCIYREALNRLGWTKLQEIKKIVLPFEECSKEFCEEQTGELVLEVANNFMTDIFPEFAQNFPIDEFQIIGLDNERKTNTNYLTKHFCNWFFHKKYTKDKLSLSPNDA